MPRLFGAVLNLDAPTSDTAIIFNRLKLQDPHAAMGLAEGSVRAIIALMLIVIFAVISIFLVSTGGTSSLHTVEGLTAAQANQYDPSEVVARVLMSGSATDPTAMYKLTLNVGNKTADQMAQQLLTTGTLVVAVASFYFGSQTVAAAHQQKAPGGAAGDGGVGGGKDTDGGSLIEEQPQKQNEPPEPQPGIHAHHIF